MILTKDELISALQDEVRVTLHLASKIEPGMLGYRPTPKQRSLLDLIQYIAIMGPIHMRGVTGQAFDMDSWREMWQSGEASAAAMDLEAAKAAIARQPDLYRELLSQCSDSDLSAELEMFGSKNSRAAWVVKLVLCHYAAYRMQLFLYLKSCGREELNTMNLWVGTDAPMLGTSGSEPARQ